MMWSKRNTNRSIVISIVLCAALTISGCGSGAGLSHGNHVAEQANGELNEGDHEGHGDAETADSLVTWTFDPEHPKAGETVSIKMSMMDGEGKPIENFVISHEKLLHLIMVSQDLSQFQHLHPEYDGKSEFKQDVVLSKGGTYRLFADYKPAGEAGVTARGEIHIAGGTDAAVPPLPDTDPSKPKTVEGMNVALDISTLAAGQQSRLTFRFEDASTGEKVSDLMPYLGAIGHVVIVGEGAEEYLHVHAEDDNGTGPEATFSTMFPKSGVYRIWGQFQRNGNLITVAYTVKVV
ncbi:hypothetical protein ACX1C1_00860 [Paenibacillus sp. strain BS8-2]